MKENRANIRVIPKIIPTKGTPIRATNKNQTTNKARNIISPKNSNNNLYLNSPKAISNKTSKVDKIIIKQ